MPVQAIATPARLAHPTTRDDAVMPMRDMGNVLDVLTRTLTLDGHPRMKIVTLLEELQDLLGYECDTELLLYRDIRRKPVPRLVERVCVGQTFEETPPRTPEQAQAAADLVGPVWEAHLEATMRRHPPMFVGTFRDLLPESDWFETTFKPKFLDPNGWTDVMTSIWVIDDDRIVSLAVFSRDDPPPFTPADEALLSVMTRATAPLIDQQMFGKPANARSADVVAMVKRLTERQQDVLLLLLRGLSEKEIARELHRSQQTVHSHVKQIYRHFDVASRGELMAMFVDDRLRAAVDG